MCLFHVIGRPLYSTIQLQKMGSREIVNFTLLSMRSLRLLPHLGRDHGQVSRKTFVESAAILES